MPIQQLMGYSTEVNTFTVTFHSTKKIGEVILLLIRPEHLKKLSKVLLLVLLALEELTKSLMKESFFNIMSMELSLLFEGLMNFMIMKKMINQF